MVIMSHRLKIAIFQLNTNQNAFYKRKAFFFYFPSLAVDLKDKANNRLMTWENIQKENFLSAEAKKLRASDTETVKRMSVK